MKDNIISKCKFCGSTISSTKPREFCSQSCINKNRKGNSVSPEARLHIINANQKIRQKQMTDGTWWLRYPKAARTQTGVKKKKRTSEQNLQNSVRAIEIIKKLKTDGRWEEGNKKRSFALKGKPQNIEIVKKRKLSVKQSLSEKRKNPQWLLERSKTRFPNKAENNFISFFNKYNLPYKYTGNATFWIESCNPDFVNTNGEKIAIEVFCDYVKNREHTSVDNYIKKRNETFTKYGWKAIYIENKELENEEKLIEKIKNFGDKKW